MSGKFKVKDHYYKKAKEKSFVARSVFKLEEIDRKFKVFREGMRVLDLGYYPGSWIQYASQKVGEKGKVFGVDISPVNEQLESEKNISLIEKDIFNITREDLGDEKFDVVLSDMAPNTSGIKSVDQERSLQLVQRVVELLPIVLEPGGDVVIKVFASQDAEEYLKQNKKIFKRAANFKPKATRTPSKEFFFVGKGYV